MKEYPLIGQIKKANDVKNIPEGELHALCREIRSFLLEKVSETGGHLSSNLGVVELTVALHRFLDLPHDKIVFDVGHQAYVHKMLTGRQDFSRLRKLGGLSGFPKIAESDCDSFNVGHSSTSLSIAAGLQTARDLNGENHKIVAVIGDGALGGGMAYEALNNIGKTKSNVIIILNDNEMSIDANVGGMANYLGAIRTNNSYTNFKNNLQHTLESVPYVGEGIVKRMRHQRDNIKALVVGGMFFEDLGFMYIGPIDGHDIASISKALESASHAHKPVIIHCLTKKGKGYAPAEKNPGKFHGIAPFDIATGKIKQQGNGKSYTSAFSEKMTELGEKHKNVVAITAAMVFGTGLNEFSKKYPDRFFDVGIAEQHAVTFASAMAKSGYRPFVAIYSSFLQRSYDQILHDVCITKQPVTFMIDRAGIVGADGETHQGIFDLSYLSHMPGMTIMTPKNCEELEMMMDFSMTIPGPCAIRYPRGAENSLVSGLTSAPIEYGRSEEIVSGDTVAIFSVGSVLDKAMELCERLTEAGISTTVINARFVSPVDSDRINEAAEKYKVIVSMEENVTAGGYGEHLASALLSHGCRAAFINAALDNAFIEHGSRDELMKLHGIDTDKIYNEIRHIFG